jgi:hypothetical protein
LAATIAVVLVLLGALLMPSPGATSESIVSTGDRAVMTMRSAPSDGWSEERIAKFERTFGLPRGQCLRLQRIVRSTSQAWQWHAAWLEAEESDSVGLLVFAAVTINGDTIRSQRVLAPVELMDCKPPLDLSRRVVPVSEIVEDRGSHKGARPLLVAFPRCDCTLMDAWVESGCVPCGDKSEKPRMFLHGIKGKHSMAR